MNTQRPASVPQRHFDSWDRLSEYAATTGKELDEELGWGNEGLVFATTAKTAIKAYLHTELYAKERDVYLRLKQRGVTAVLGFSVPKFVRNSDELLVVEMSIVSPPFILDFAGAYLDEKPPYDDETLEQWEQEKIEQFEDRWPSVRSAMSVFKRHGIYLNDVKPGNVCFDEADE